MALRALYIDERSAEIYSKIAARTCADVLKGGDIIIDKETEIKSALIKCATGLSASETVEEFAAVDGELKLVKRKVTKREIPPDIKAVKLILDGSSEELSDEELEAERDRLLKMLKEEEN